MPATKSAGSDLDRITARARDMGFDAVGVATPDATDAAGRRLADFLERGWHGDMAWMARNAERRASPRALWPEVRSIIMLGMNYGPGPGALKDVNEPGAGAISVYARGQDYHDVIKKRLKRLGRWMADELGTTVRVFVDTAPVMEKPLAQEAGIGWQGKHTNLVSREHGSWLFLGAVFTTLDLPPGPARADRCGTCSRCLDICPTNAFPAPYRLDARRCISYLTIEHKGHIPVEFRAAIGNRVFGCDDCLAVCPWNKFAAAAREAALAPRPELTGPGLLDLVRLDDTAFREMFRGTAVKRLGRDRLVRNVLVAIGNRGDAGYVPEVEVLLEDPSPLVRAMAVWALTRLAPPRRFERLAARHLTAEPDPEVRAEWTAHRPPRPRR